MNSRNAHHQKLVPKIAKVDPHLMSGREFFLSFEEIVFFLKYLSSSDQRISEIRSGKECEQNVRGNNDEKICHYSSCCLLSV